MANLSRIYTYDTTLRDGSQMQGISYSVNDKLQIIKLLDHLKIDYIEAGWPGANPKDQELFSQLQNYPLKHSQLVAFGMTKRASSNSCDEDPILQNLLNANTPIITLVAKFWDLHVHDALRISLEQNIDLIVESIQYLQQYDKKVIIDAEHFVDGYKSNATYIYQIIDNIYKLNIYHLTLCDTNGGSLPHEITTIVKDIATRYPNLTLSIHTHNDCDLAVANSLVAIESGVQCIQGTINGYGERCGNANLISVISNLILKYKQYDINADLSNLTNLSKQISDISNLNHSNHQPFVGKYAFAHKGGLHASAMSKNTATYEHINPNDIGNKRHILVSEQAGISNIIDFAQNRNIQINKLQAQAILKIIKDKEYIGYQYEQASASLELLLLKYINNYPKYYELVDFHVSSIYNRETEATTRIQISNTELHTASLGVGPGHALDLALRKAISNYYPEQINLFHLSDFKVRVVDSHDGTAAITKVNVQSTGMINNIQQIWNTTSVNENILQAILEAISESLIFGLYKLQTPVIQN